MSEQATASSVHRAQNTSSSAASVLLLRACFGEFSLHPSLSSCGTKAPRSAVKSEMNSAYSVGWCKSLAVGLVEMTRRPQAALSGACAGGARCVCSVECGRLTAAMALVVSVILQMAVRIYASQPARRSRSHDVVRCLKLCSCVAETNTAGVWLPSALPNHGAGTVFTNKGRSKHQA